MADTWDTYTPPAEWGVPAGWVFVDNSATPNNGDQTISNSVLGNSTSTEGPDQWGGFFKQMVSTGFNYALQKDAVTSGIAPRTVTPKSYSANGQPVYTNPPPQGASNQSLMMLGLLVVGGVLLVKG